MAHLDLALPAKTIYLIIHNMCKCAIHSECSYNTKAYFKLFQETNLHCKISLNMDITKSKVCLRIRTVSS